MAFAGAIYAELEKPEGQKIIWAAKSGKTGDVIELLERGVNVDSADEYGQTTLMWALSNGNIECVKVLLSRGAQADCTDKDGRTPLMMVASQGSVECLKILLECGMEVNRQNKEGRTPLMEAAYGGSAECVKMLLDRGAQVNIQDKNGHSPLMRATLGGKAECVKLLLDHGAQINLQDKEGLTPSMRASYRGNVECLKVLLDRGAQVNQQDKERTPLMEAALGAKVECVQLLLDRGAHVNEQNKGGRTSLMEALSGGSIECAKLLLDRGAQTNQQDKLGQTALMMASLQGDVECVKLLLDRGAEVNQRNENGRTPLLEALEQQTVECVKLLLDNHALVNQQDQHGRTPLMKAACRGVVEFVEVLLNKGAMVNEQNKDGDTALHRAIKEGHVSCAKALLIHPGTDPKMKNHNGLTCLDMMNNTDEESKVLPKMVEIYDSFPVASYSKVVLCGSPGAGKSTLSQVITELSKPITKAARLAKQAFGGHITTEVGTGAILHQIDSLYGNMILYDLPGHHQNFSLENPATFVLLHDLTKDSGTITKELYRWSTVIDDMCLKCQCQSSIIVVGTHIDLLTAEQRNSKLALLQSVAREAIKQQTIAGTLVLNLTKTYGRKMSQFMDLLHQTNDAIIKKSPSISLLCHVLYAFLKEKLSILNVDAITLSDLLAHLAADPDRLIVSTLAEVIPLLKCLSEKGLIFFVLSNDPYSSWVVLHIEHILRRVCSLIFQDHSLKDYYHVARNTGMITKNVISLEFPEYNTEMVIPLLINFELCQIVELPLADTSIDGTSEDNPLLFFPDLIRTGRPTSARPSNENFHWLIVVNSSHQFFSTRFLFAAIRRLAIELSLPSLEAAPLYVHLGRCCEIWQWGIVWHGEMGIAVTAEMGEDFQSFSLAVSCCDRAEPKYLTTVRTAISIVKKAYQEFSPHVEMQELISCPSVTCTDHFTGGNVELSSLKRALLQHETHVADLSGQKHILCDWMKVEPCLPYLIEVSSAVETDHIAMEGNGLKNAT